MGMRYRTCGDEIADEFINYDMAAVFFSPIAFSATPEEIMPMTMPATMMKRYTGNEKWKSSGKTSPHALPHVPGAKGRYPTGPRVAMFLRIDLAGVGDFIESNKACRTIKPHDRHSRKQSASGILLCARPDLIRPKKDSGQAGMTGKRNPS